MRNALTAWLTGCCSGRCSADSQALAGRSQGFKVWRMRRRVAIGAAVALAGGFAIERLTEVLDVSQGLAVLAFFCLIVSVTIVVMGRTPRSSVQAPKPR